MVFLAKGPAPHALKAGVQFARFSDILISFALF